MSDHPAPDPIAILLQGHAFTRARLQDLAAGAPDADAAAWFDGPAPAQRRLLTGTLCPALIESMAGSDAVCLKGMTQGLAEQDTSLGRRWPGIRAALGGHDADPAALAAWIEDYRAYLRCADEELLPMAERLLDDQALEQLRIAAAAP